MTGFCIYCGADMERNLNQPSCVLCSGSCSACNRSSFTDKTPMFCHYCGECDYVQEENPLCYDCSKL